MGDYFGHENISNSDLKKFKTNLGGGREAPANLQAIYDFGSLFHRSILEPHLITKEDREHPDFKLAERMQKTFWRDELCRNFMMASDFSAEVEFYDTYEVGGMRIKARAKADGHRSKLGFFMEIKGLNVDTEKAFQAALLNFDYDQAAVHYMLTSKCNVCLLPGISKKKDVMFKRIIKKHDDFYLGGEHKLIETLKQLHQYSPEDVEIL